MASIESTARRLLVLDDNVAIGITISMIAETLENTEAWATTDPIEFYEVVREWQPTHIILDLVMPNVDGIEVLRQLGGIQCSAAIIITSGVGSRVLDAAQRSAAEHGLDVAGVLPKPFSAQDLQDLLNLGKAPRLVQTRYGNEATAFTQITYEALATAIEAQQFVLHYQPKVHCATGQLAGFEALVRWQHPRLGLVPPNSFIPLAERTGLITPLTDQIIHQALQWLSATFCNSTPTLSLNLSARSLSNIQLADHITAVCHQQQVDPQRLILEITETSAMGDPVTTLDLLTRFRIKGLQLSIDDFGVGYSSLIQLARLPFSELKIDKMFVSTAPQSLESQTIIKAIVRLGHALGLTVTAEGVENPRVLSFLQAIECDLAQGYLIGRPLPPEHLSLWLEQDLTMQSQGQTLMPQDI
jgi:EAL domain-containing protein (putative c-di-GMP-specific phosphodiesterase class I)/FixJ family two-component response regulator